MQEDGGIVGQHFCLGERVGMTGGTCIDRSLYSLLADTRNTYIFAFLVATVQYPAGFIFSEARHIILIRKIKSNLAVCFICWERAYPLEGFQTNSALPQMIP